MIEFIGQYGPLILLLGWIARLSYVARMPGR